MNCEDRGYKAICHGKYRHKMCTQRRALWCKYGWAAVAVLSLALYAAESATR